MSEPKEIWVVEYRYARPLGTREPWLVLKASTDMAKVTNEVLRANDRRGNTYKYRVRRYIPAPEPSPEDILRREQEA